MKKTYIFIFIFFIAILINCSFNFQKNFNINTKKYLNSNFIIKNINNNIDLINNSNNFLKNSSSYILSSDVNSNKKISESTFLTSNLSYNFVKNIKFFENFSYLYIKTLIKKYCQEIIPRAP